MLFVVVCLIFSLIVIYYYIFLVCFHLLSVYHNEAFCVAVCYIKGDMSTHISTGT